MTRIRSYTDTVDPGSLNHELDDMVRRIEALETTILAHRIRDGNITQVKLADDIISTAKLEDGSVTTAKLATGAVTTAKILDGTIGEADIDWTSNDGVLAARVAGFAGVNGGVLAFVKDSFTTNGASKYSISIDLTDDTLYYPFGVDGVAPAWTVAPFVGGITASHTTNPDLAGMTAHCITGISTSQLDFNYYCSTANTGNIVVVRVILWGEV